MRLWLRCWDQFVHQQQQQLYDFAFNGRPPRSLQYRRSSIFFTGRTARALCHTIAPAPWRAVSPIDLRSVIRGTSSSCCLNGLITYEAFHSFTHVRRSVMFLAPLQSVCVVPHLGDCSARICSTCKELKAVFTSGCPTDQKIALLLVFCSVQKKVIS